MSCCICLVSWAQFRFELVFCQLLKGEKPGVVAVSEWWTRSDWLVVDLPLWKIWKSMGRIIPYIMEKKKWLKSPSSISLSFDYYPQLYSYKSPLLMVNPWYSNPITVLGIPPKRNPIHRKMNTTSNAAAPGSSMVNQPTTPRSVRTCNRDRDLCVSWRGTTNKIPSGKLT